MQPFSLPVFVYANASAPFVQVSNTALASVLWFRALVFAGA